MTAHVLSWSSPLRSWLSVHPYTSLGFVVLAFLFVPFLSRGDSEWEYVYVQAAHQLRNGLDIYSPEIGNSYPPFATFIALPFTWLSPDGQRWLWMGINVGSLIYILRGAWRLAGGGPVEGVNWPPRREQMAAILGGLCGVFYLQNCLAHQQTDIVLGALLIGGCLALNLDRSLLASTLFGLAAAVKCTPLLWAPYLVWRRRPLAALWLVVVAFGVNLLPDLVQPSASGHLWLTEFSNRLLRPLGDSDRYVGTWGSALVYNQSLAGAGQRWFVTTWQWGANDCVVLPRSDALGPKALRAIVTGVEGFLVLLTLAICRRPFQRLSAGATGSVPRNALEYSVVFLLMLLLSPMSSKAHFGVLILPGFCLARAALCEKRRWLLPIAVAAVLIATATNKDPLGERLYTLSLWLGCVTWETLLLLVGCYGLLAASDKPLSHEMTSPATGEGLRSAA